MKNNILVRAVLILISVIGIILVRHFQYELFYDPFLDYFKGDFHSKDIIDTEVFRLNLSMILRYTLNAVFTVIIIHALFNNRGYSLFSVIVLLISLIILMLVWNYMLECGFCMGKMKAFYVRRFIIQPLMLLILVPSLYYQKRNEG